jgi:hypothetical protein
MSAPTEKQLNYIASLLDRRDNAFHSVAYGAIGDTVGMSSSKAAKAATSRDASKTIDRLLRRNPAARKIKGKSTTLKNMASVTVTKLSNGVVKITGRKLIRNPVRRSGRKPPWRPKSYSPSARRSLRRKR